MKLKGKISTVITLVVIVTSTLIFSSCNKRCANLQGGVSSGVIREYDFGDCKVYARVDTNLIISTTAEFNAYKDAKLKVCNNGTLPAVDFNQEVLLAFKISEIACNVGFKKSILIDTAAKTYNYIVVLDKCTGCNTEITSHNWVVGPAIPTGFKVNFIKR